MGYTHEWLAEALAANPHIRISRDSSPSSQNNRQVAIGTGSDGKVQPDTAKRQKYGNVSVEQGGIRFDSKREAARWLELRMLDRAGEIWKLERQVPFEFRHQSILICRYVADFVYYEQEGKVVEDCKGVRTAVYKLKRKMMEAFYGITIRET